MVKKHLKFIILTLLKCIVHYVKYIYNVEPRLFRTFSSRKMGTLHPLNSSPFSLLPALGHRYSPFCCHEFDYFQITHINGIIQELSFCDWLISVCIMSSKFIHVPASDLFIATTVVKTIVFSSDCNGPNGPLASSLAHL